MVIEDKGREKERKSEGEIEIGGERESWRERERERERKREVNHIQDYETLLSKEYCCSEYRCSSRQAQIAARNRSR